MRPTGLPCAGARSHERERPRSERERETRAHLPNRAVRSRNIRCYRSQLFVDGAAAESAFQWAHSLRSHKSSAAPSPFAIALQLSLRRRTVAAANDIVCRFASSVGGEASGNGRTTFCRLQPEKMISRELCLHICLFFFLLLVLHFRLSHSHSLACERKDSSDNSPLGLFACSSLRAAHPLPRNSLSN